MLIRDHLLSALRSLEQFPDHVEAEFSPASTKETECVENGVYKHGTSIISRTNGHHVNGHTNGHATQGLREEASYLIGCDGANSAVRRLSSITQTDLGFENDWLIVDLVSLVCR